MIHPLLRRTLLGAALLIAALIWPAGDLRADATLYPKYAQQQLPAGVAPDFIYMSQLTPDLAAVGNPLMIDVRPKEEFQEAHIKGAISIPLGDVPNRLKDIPKNRPLVLY